MGRQIHKGSPVLEDGIAVRVAQFHLLPRRVYVRPRTNSENPKADTSYVIFVEAQMIRTPETLTLIPIILAGSTR